MKSDNKQSIGHRAKECLVFATRRAKTAKNFTDLHNALYGPGGKATELFPTPNDRRAFKATKEAKQIFALFDMLPTDAPKAKIAEASGAFNLRLPKSLHASLTAEAEAEGVSLNQLCLAKLAAQLRELV